MSVSTARYRPPSDPRELVLAWLRRARESQMAHYEMADTLSRREYFLGVPVIFLTAVVGTSIFATITAQVVPTQAKVVVGLASVIAAVLSSLQTFFKFSERAEKHRTYGARFGAVRRELELFYVEDGATNKLNQIAIFREKLDRLAEEAPPVPSKVFLKVQQSVLYTDERSGVPGSRSPQSVAAP